MKKVLTTVVLLKRIEEREQRVFWENRKIKRMVLYAASSFLSLHQ